MIGNTYKLTARAIILLLIMQTLTLSTPNATDQQFNFADENLNLKLKPRVDPAFHAARIARHKIATQGAAHLMMYFFDPIYERTIQPAPPPFTSGGFQDLLDRKQPYENTTKALDKLAKLLDASFKRVREAIPPTDDQTLLNIFSGGFENAYHTQIALAKVAYIKLEEFCKKTGAKLEDLIDRLIQNNKHCLIQMGSLNIAVMQLIENLNGIVANQNNTYSFKPENFEIANYQGELYLLPTLNFINSVIRSANPHRKTLLKLFRHGKVIEVPFEQAHVGPMVGCPVFARCTTLHGDPVDLANHYLSKTALLIQAVVHPSQANTEGLDQRLRDLKLSYNNPHA